MHIHNSPKLQRPHAADPTSIQLIYCSRDGRAYAEAAMTAIRQNADQISQHVQDELRGVFCLASGSWEVIVGGGQRVVFDVQSVFGGLR